MFVVQEYFWTTVDPQWLQYQLLLKSFKVFPSLAVGGWAESPLKIQYCKDQRQDNPFDESQNIRWQQHIHKTLGKQQQEYPQGEYTLEG